MSESRYLICFCPWFWVPGSPQARDLSLSSLGVSSRFAQQPFGPENRAGLCSSPRTLPIQPPPPAITIAWPPPLVEQSTGPQILLDSHVLLAYSSSCGVSSFAELVLLNLSQQDAPPFSMSPYTRNDYSSKMDRFLPATYRRL